MKIMKVMVGGSYAQALRRTAIPEWVSMNAVMDGVAPVMVILMRTGGNPIQPDDPRFWGIMSLAALLGGRLAYPVSLWLVAAGLKHGMGTEQAIGRGGHSMEVEQEIMLQRTEPARSMPTRQARDEDQPGGSGAPRRSRAPLWRVSLVITGTLALLVIGLLIAAEFGNL